MRWWQRFRCLSFSQIVEPATKRTTAYSDLREVGRELLEDPQTDFTAREKHVDTVAALTILTHLYPAGIRATHRQCTRPDLRPLRPQALRGRSVSHLSTKNLDSQNMVMLLVPTPSSQSSRIRLSVACGQCTRWDTGFHTWRVRNKHRTL